MSAVDGDLAVLRSEGERDLLAFKSVGTAVQDLALAQSALDAAGREGRGRELGELTRLKAFSSSGGDFPPVSEGAV
jgi:ornithine cyclodeaminase/alanine dehydrogenase